MGADNPISDFERAVRQWDGTATIVKTRSRAYNVTTRIQWASASVARRPKIGWVVTLNGYSSLSTHSWTAPRVIKVMPKTAPLEQVAEVVIQLLREVEVLWACKYGGIEGFKAAVLAETGGERAHPDSWKRFGA